MTWDSLEGDDPIERHCSACDKSVFNLSGMTQIDAAEFLAARVVDPPCVRFRLEDGRIAHAEAEKKIRSQGIGAAKLVAAAAMLNLGTAVLLENPYAVVLGPYASLLQSCGNYQDDTDLTGAIAYDPRPAAVANAVVDCSRESCPDVARAAYGRALAHAASDSPSKTYDAFLEYSIAAEVLAKWGIPAEEVGMADLRARMESHEAALDAEFRAIRVSHHEKQQRRQKLSPQEWDAFKARFSDQDNRWMQWVRQTERADQGNDR